MHSKVLEELRPRPLYYMTHRQLSAAGMPIGEAGAGPAYGEKRGPAIALFGAFQAISIGMTVGGLMGGMMIAGGVLSGLGALTGNKTLSRLGMVAGLAGAVGQFFSVGGFEAMGSAWSSGEGVSGGLSNMADQFMGNANFMQPGGMAPVVDAAGLAIPSIGDQIVQPSMSASSIMSNASPFAPDPTISQMGVAFPGAAPGMGAPTPAPGPKSKKETGLLGLWKDQGDYTKYGLINAAAGALKGAGEADAAEEQRKADEPLRDAREKQIIVETEAIKKKSEGPKAVSVGEFGANMSAGPFGKNTDGTSRSYDQYVEDRTNALRKLFGSPAQQTATA